jgi:23S rRNA (uracil1939-C5)-methyltransferase
MKKGDVLELKIDKYAFEGKGIARVNRDEEDTERNFVVFVENSFPGDTVKAKVLKVKKSYAEAKTTEVVVNSPYRGKASCKYFTVCGGCRQQDIDYDVQAKHKQDQVEEIFNRLGGFKDLQLESISSLQISNFYYSNKMEFSFSSRRWLTTDEISSGETFDKDFALGLHVPGTFDKVLDIDECFLQSVTSNGILNYTREFFKEKQSTIFSTKTQSGYLRNLVIREGKKTGDLMVNLVTYDDNEELMQEYSRGLTERFPEITTIVNNVSKKRSAIALGDYEKVYFGKGYITDTIGNKIFKISANSFFQTNTLQAEKLYNTVMEYAEFKENDVVYDLYSGAGTITIYMSGEAKKIYGFESSESAIKDAAENAELNKAENVDFVVADLFKSFLPFVEGANLPVPDIIVTDPPRSGMHKNIIEDILKLAPPKVIYVSCNPATQVRDIKFLEEKYELIKIRPVDMFPHTTIS